MNAISYNITLTTPLLMLAAWVFVKIVANNNFAERYKTIYWQPKLNDRHELSVIAAKTLYENSGGISSVKYILATFKVCFLWAKAVSLIISLYVMQYDDGTLYFSDIIDDQGMYYIYTLLFITIGSLIFNIIFYIYFRDNIFRKICAKNMIKMIIIFISFAVFSPVISVLLFIIGDWFFLGHLIPGSQVIWLIYITDVIPSKFLIFPSIILILISMVSFLFPFIVYYFIFFATKRKVIFLYLKNTSMYFCVFNSSFSNKVLSVLNILQFLYWTNFYFSIILLSY